MFENLSHREKMMAGIVGCLVPLGILFFVFVSYYNEYRERRTRISGLENQLVAEQQKQLDAAQANLRRNFYYRNESLPSHDARAVIRYRDWLVKAVDESGLAFPNINPSRPVAVVNKDAGISTVANKHTSTLTTSGSLDQLVAFLHEFEQLNLLHKIVNLTIRPIKRKEILTGKHSITMKIEALALVDADEQREFLIDRSATAVAIGDYESKILTRNVFGPANNPPTLSLSRKTFEEDDEISISLSARDQDKSDELSYEIVDAGGIEGAEIESKGNNRATFKSPPLEIGEYQIKIRVSDNGFPAKSTEDDCTIVVKEKRAPPIVKEEPKPPPFQNAKKTQVKRISARNGVFEVKISVLTEGDTYVLKEGEEFELDDKKWMVVKIEAHSIKIEVDGETLDFKLGDFLDSPRNKKTADKPDVAEVSTASS